LLLVLLFGFAKVARAVWMIVGLILLAIVALLVIGAMQGDQVKLPDAPKVQVPLLSYLFDKVKKCSVLHF
jgi:hypothetical protein